MKEKIKEETQHCQGKKGFLAKLKQIGPGALVAAAFIGPGTVTTATICGASFGYTLLWAMLFSIIATMVLQEMSSRLGVVTRKGIGEALRNQFDSPTLKWMSIILVISAIGIGCAAYETGNILGGALGLETITGISGNIWGPVMGIIAFLFLWTGSYNIIEKILVGLVGVMSVTFILTAIIIRPDIGAILKGFFAPTIPKGGLMLAVSLIGTTVVPYNLFLHASAVQERWNSAEELSKSRLDTLLSIGLGGAISSAIIITAAATFKDTGIVPNNAGEMAIQLEPLLGTWAKWFFGIGLFAAGFSSSVTSPLAAAYATVEALGWKNDFKSTKFKLIWGIVLIVGIIGSGLGKSPVTIILFAQAANGILLPIIALFLMILMNNEDRLGEYANSKFQNLLGWIVTAVAFGLGIKSLYSVLQKLIG
ncbi:Nramp family divalent metal transporter [Acetohalobium arabaticum]|uniref:Natural resistance-associated macrophage protein n=1 Tax=Acetohalobium arabaticum (strain ATCC 49924 / DSM 5501 / Z-7288) TaxID=574087 RepID=D9QUX5_ACEAZ|nr:Nramp family divalent metal transporter [Acetohalobium arabaticum]ADL12034.1 natural resistance-associated macrophage protein [Acetohalobium arabaticum DSM 5501]